MEPTLQRKIGPRDRPVPTVVTATAQLNAYVRVTRAATIVGQGGALQAPALHISDEQLAALFTPKQLLDLVVRPLHREVPRCL